MWLEGDEVASLKTKFKSFSFDASISAHASKGYDLNFVLREAVSSPSRATKMGIQKTITSLL